MLHQVKTFYNSRIPTGDPNVTLSADVYLPATQERVPALVTVLPYRKDLPSYIADDLVWFAERGYACLRVDLRGVGSSDGIPRPKYDATEGNDAVAAIEWAAEQSWCTGDVGMWGHSYGGLMALRAAVQSPSALKAIIPIESPIDPERDVAHPDGARSDLLPLVRWGGGMLLQQLLPPLVDYSEPAEQLRWHHRLHDVEPYILEQALRMPGEPLWRSRSIDTGSITVPTFCVGGWNDVVCDASIRTYEGISGPKKLLVGPWVHREPHMSSVEPIDFLPMALRWWDYWLRGSENGLMDELPVTLYVQGRNPGWRTFESWPPKPNEFVLATGADTTMTESAREDSPRDSGVIAKYDPDPTIGTLSGLTRIGADSFALSLDLHEDDVRSLSATSRQLPCDLLICGRSEVSVRLATEKSPTLGRAARRLVVRLAEVDTKGRSKFIAGGVLCPEEPSEDLRIVLWPTTRRVRAGHQLRVVITDSDFPRLAPLIAPAPLVLAGVELVVPILPDDAGAPIDMAPPPEGASESGIERRWTISRDLVHGGIDVELGSKVCSVVTRQGHLLETQEDLQATVRRDTPAAAVTTGTHNAVLHMRTGERITATVTVRCSHTALWVRGEVAIDGLTIFSRMWESSLAHGSDQ